MIYIFFCSDYGITDTTWLSNFCKFFSAGISYNRKIRIFLYSLGAMAWQSFSGELIESFLICAVPGNGSYSKSYSKIVCACLLPNMSF
ncbi:MAG: hypothetical protein N2254_09260 [bacterium]|nr:hypothetical protein [bacterium]